MSEDFNPFRWLDEKISKQLSESERRQYLTFVKPIIESIEMVSSKLPIQSKEKTGDFKILRIDASALGGVNFKVIFERPWVYFVGLMTGANFTVPVDSITTDFYISDDPQISLERRIPLNIGDIVRVPTGKEMFIVSNGGTTGFLTFIMMDDPDSFFKVYPEYRISSNGTVARPSLDSNRDQFVIFRATPTVNVGTFPANQKVIVTDSVSDLDVDASGRIAVNIATQPIFVDERTGADFHQQQTAGAGAAVTMTITATIGDLRMNFIDISMYSTAARTGGATPVSVTISGFEDNNGNAVTLNYPFPTAAAVGTVYHLHIDGAQLFRASTSAGPTNIVITCPGTASVIWRVNASYRDN